MFMYVYIGAIFVLSGLFWTFGGAYRIVRVVDRSINNQTDSLNKKIFFLNNGVASAIHHRETFIELGYSDDKKCQKLKGKKELFSWRDSAKPTKAIAHYVCINEVGPEEIAKYKRGAPLPLLARKERTLDECMMMEMRKIDIVQGQMVFDKMFINFGINPSVLKWQESLFMATSLAWGVEEAPKKGTSSGKVPSECVEFNWVNISSLNSVPLIHKGVYTKNLPRNQRVVYPFKSTKLGVTGITERVDRIVGGQDPRLIVLDEKNVGMVMTERFAARRLRVGFSVIGVNMTSAERKEWSQKSNIDLFQAHPTYIPEVIMHSDDIFYSRKDNKVPYGGHRAKSGENLVITHSFRDLETGDIAHDEKNWSPFLHDLSGKNKTRSLLFVRQINPLVVMRCEWEKVYDNGVVPLKTVSAAKKVDMSFWGYGTLRGGTNPILIDGKYYLSIFHSVSTIPGDGVFKSYTMGAFTFSAKAPFKLMGVSALPFMDKDLYQGAYAEIWRRMYDYVIFPMTLSRESEKTLLLSFGWQDRYQMLGKLDLQSVLDTLVPVGDFANLSPYVK